jgi:hypothetical protein
MKKVLLVALAVIVYQGYAQKDTTAPPVYGWAHSVVSGVNLSQVSFTNWAPGGDNALSWTGTLEGKSADDQPQINWTNAYKFAYGQTRLGNQGLRKTDDKIDLESVLIYKIGPNLNPYVSASLKSQFSRGYKYDASGSSSAVSDFFDPAYLTQMAGVALQPIPELKTRLGAGFREVLTTEFPAYADNPATAEIEKTKVEGGLESVTELTWKMEENIQLIVKVELFDAFKKMDQIIVRNDNSLVMKVNKYITALLNVQLVNEAPVDPRTQVKEVIALGLSYTIL